MGFLKVTDKDELNIRKMLSYWSDAVFAENSPRICITSALLENGKKILVAPLQLLIQIREKKVIDVITEKGGYIYHSDLEKNKAAEQYAEILNEYFQKEDAVSQDTELVYINLFRDNDIVNQIKEYIELKKEKIETLDAAVESNEGECTTNVNLTQTVVQQDEWVCKCGTINKFNFCKNCGLPKPVEERVDGNTKFCRECGNRLPVSGIKFCPNCGTKL